MIRQAHSYFLGAVSGTALIAAAVIASVLLISAQALKDWPIAGFGFGGGDAGSVSPARPLEGTATANSASFDAGAGGAAADRTAGGPVKAADVDRAAAQPAGVVDSEIGSSLGAPTRTAPAGAGTPGGSPASGGSSPASPGNGGGGSGTGTASSGNGGGGSGGGGSSTSAGVTNTVNDTVAGVDGALGGTLGNAGVTKATEEVVNGVAGPESTVGKTVDGVGKAVQDTVGGLLGANR